MIKHIVFFKLIDPQEENLYKCRDILLNMKGKVEQLQSIEIGFDYIRSKRSYDMALVTEFDTDHDLEDYQRHPVHITAQNHLSPFIEHSVTVDYKLET